MSTAEPRRGPRNGSTVRATPPKAEPPASKPETATETLARLQWLRDANRGFLVPKPAGIDGARLIVRTDGESGPPLLDAGCKAALAWLKAIAEAGGSPADIHLAWHSWRVDAGELNPKSPLEAHLEALVNEAGPRWQILNARAEEEQRPAKIVADMRRQLREAEARLADEQRHLVPFEMAVTRAKTAVAEAERALKEAS